MGFSCESLGIEPTTWLISSPAQPASGRARERRPGGGTRRPHPAAACARLAQCRAPPASAVPATRCARRRGAPPPLRCRVTGNLRAARRAFAPRAAATGSAASVAENRSLITRRWFERLQLQHPRGELQALQKVGESLVQGHQRCAPYPRPRATVAARVEALHQVFSRAGESRSPSSTWQRTGAGESRWPR